MRFSRLKKTIEAHASMYSASSVAAKSKTESKKQEGPNNSTNTKMTGKGDRSANSKFGKRQIDQAGNESNIKSENDDAKSAVLSATAKRQTRGRKIDVSSAFESDSSPALGAQIGYQDDASDHEEAEAVAAEEDDDFFPGGPNSDTEPPAKRRRSVPSERNLSRSDPFENSFFDESSQSSPQDVEEQQFPTAGVAISPLSDVPLFEHCIPLQQYRPARPDLITESQPLIATGTTDLISPPSDHIASPSIPPPQFTVSSSNPKPSRSTIRSLRNSVFDDASASDIMPSIDYDDSKNDSVFDSTTAVAGGSVRQDEEMIRQNDSMGCS